MLTFFLVVSITLPEKTPPQISCFCWSSIPTNFIEMSKRTKPRLEIVVTIREIRTFIGRQGSTCTPFSQCPVFTRRMMEDVTVASG